MHMRMYDSDICFWLTMLHLNVVEDKAPCMPSSLMETKPYARCRRVHGCVFLLYLCCPCWLSSMHNFHTQSACPAIGSFHHCSSPKSKASRPFVDHRCGLTPQP